MSALVLAGIQGIAGCSGSNETRNLAEAAHSTEIEVNFEPAAGAGVTIGLAPTAPSGGGSDCLTSANLTAKQDGTLMTLDSLFRGGWGLSDGPGVVCEAVVFDSVVSPSPGEAATTFQISDGTTTWTVVVENMAAKRSVALADPQQVVHPGDGVALIWSPASDSLDFSNASVQGFPGGLEADVSVTGNSLSFVVPASVPAGTLTLTISGDDLAVYPNVSQCSGPKACGMANAMFPALDGFGLTIAP